jgi:hypothetical protein
MVNAEKEAKNFFKLSEENPLLTYGIGGLAAAGAIWLFNKIATFFSEKFPNMAAAKYFTPIAKTITVIGLYFVSKAPVVKKIPFVEPAIFGAGVALFGSMIADYAVTKVSEYTTPASSGSNAGTSATAPTNTGAAASDSSTGLNSALFV